MRPSKAVALNRPAASNETFRVRNVQIRASVVCVRLRGRQLVSANVRFRKRHHV